MGIFSRISELVSSAFEAIASFSPFGKSEDAPDFSGREFEYGGQDSPDIPPPVDQYETEDTADAPSPDDWDDDFASADDAIDEWLADAPPVDQETAWELRQTQEYIEDHLTQWDTAEGAYRRSFDDMEAVAEYIHGASNADLFQVVWDEFSGQWEVFVIYED